MILDRWKPGEIGFRVFTREDMVTYYDASAKFAAGYNAALERVIELFDNTYPGLLDSRVTRSDGSEFVCLVGDGDTVRVTAVLEVPDADPA